MNWKEYFNYDSTAGKLVWLTRPLSQFSTPRSHKAWNSQFSGAIAGCYNHKYATVSINNRAYPVHRIVWEMHYGQIPEGMLVDHINCNGVDNRLDNLRLATISQNAMNRRVAGRTGAKGVHITLCGKYRAELRVDGKRVFQATFSTLEEASNARSEAANKYHGEFAR